MEPADVKRRISDHAKQMMLQMRQGKINYDTVVRVIESECRDGARHNGVPEYWRTYIPVDVLQP